jgi:hypothetical protein
MPKTAVLHIHSDVCCKRDWLLNLFKLFPDNIYKNQKNSLYYFFDKSVPDDDGEYVLIETLRQISPNPKGFLQAIVN